MSGGGALTAPALPSTGTSFPITITGVSGNQSGSLNIVASAITDACGASLAANASINLVGQCVGDVSPPTVTSASFKQRPDGTGTTTYTLTFSEPTALAANALTVGNAAISNVVPALPATAASFDVTVTGLTAERQLHLPIDDN